MDKADRSAGFEMRARYVSNLEEAFRRDIRRLEKYQQILDRRPLTIPVKFDFAGLQREASKARDIVESALRMPTILGPSGAPARGMEQQITRAAGRIATVTQKNYDKLGKTVKSITESATDQLGPGVQRTTRTKIDPTNGNRTLKAEIDKDTRSLEAFNAEMNRARQLTRDFSKAKGRGDVAGQKAALEGQIKAIGGQGGILARGAQGGLTGTAAFTRAENRLDRLRDTLAALEGREESTAAKDKRRGRTRTVDRFITGEERRVQTALKANKLEADQAERIPDRTAREAELNRIYDERRKIFERSQGVFQRLDQRLQEQGRPDLADRAFRRTLGMGNQANQVDLDKSRLDTDSMRAAAKEKEKAAAEAAKAAEAQAKADRERKAADLDRRMLDSRKQVERNLAEIGADERSLLAKAKSKDEKQNIKGKMAERRQSVLQGGASAMLGFEAEADGLGKTKTSLAARGSRMDYGKKEIDLLNRQAEAASRGGKAFDFHSSSLLRNAASFARWSAAAGSVLALMRLLSTGLGDMTRVDRQFATLKAVFRGTDEEAQRLKEGTLDLAVANGRSAEEAMDATTRFSRLGLTRVQVLKATETALKAANVAEVDAAYAAEKLSSIMATYKVTVEDLPDVLNKANAMSNRFNVTNKDLFEVMSRASGIGKQMGLEMTDLMAAGAAVTGATGRPGAETGNAIRYIMQQIGDPRKIEQLKSLFDFDVTDGTGNLRDMQSVLTDMAKLFPTLTNHQRAMFTELIAGSRQADRFTKLMEGMTTQQYLSAKAFADTDSAWKENENITESLASKIQSLQSAWSDLWVTIGDSGVLAIATDSMEALGLMVDSITARASKGGSKGGVKLGDLNDRTLVANATNAGAALFPSKTITEGQAAGGLQNIRSLKTLRDAAVKSGIQPGDTRVFNKFTKDRSADEEALYTSWLDLINRGGMTQDNADANIRFAQKGGNRYRLFDGRDFGGDTKEAADAQIEAMAARMESLVGEQTKAKSVNITTDARNRVEFLKRGQQGFAGLAERVKGGAGTYDAETAQKDFDQFAELLLDLPGGPQEFARTYARTREGIRDGTAGPELERLTGLFGAELPGATKAFAGTQESETARLQEELIRLDDQRQAGLEAIAAKREAGTTATEEEVKAQEELKAKIKETGDALSQVQRGLETVKKGGLSMMDGLNLTKSIDRTLGQSRSSVEAIKGAVGGFSNQPAERGFLMDSLSITAPENALKRRLAEAESGVRRMPNPENIEIRDRTRFRLRELQDENLKKRDELADTAPGREFADAIQRGARRGTMASQSALYGRSESEKMLNQSRFLLREIGTDGQQLAGASNNFRDKSFLSPQEKGVMAGGLLAKEQAVRENLLTLETRQYAIAADRKNLEIELTEAQKEQTREASKRLLMASREDQLRAAALKRTTNASGRISQDEFMFLGDASRNAVQSFAPDQAPDILNDAKENYRKGREALDREEAAIAQSLEGLRLVFEKNEEAMTRLMGKDGFLPTDPGRVPEFKLNVQPVVTIALAEEFMTITESAVRRILMPELETINRRISGIGKVPTTGANGASGN